MTEYRGLRQLVERAIVTAVDDGTKGTLENIRFDVEDLARVITATTTLDRLTTAAAVCDEHVFRWIRESTNRADPAVFAHARAALALKDKLTSPRGRLYREDRDGNLIPVD
jgi:hypothetical protein